MSRTGAIYALCEPDGTVRYVGKTVQSPGTRRGDHVREACRRQRRSQVHDWVRSLVRLGTGPALWVLEDGVCTEDLHERERTWIAAFRGWGADLLNYTGGGNGGVVLSEKERDRCRRIAAAKDRCPDTGRFLS